MVFMNYLFTGKGGELLEFLGKSGPGCENGCTIGDLMEDMDEGGIGRSVFLEESSDG